MAASAAMAATKAARSVATAMAAKQALARKVVLEWVAAGSGRPVQLRCISKAVLYPPSPPPPCAPLSTELPFLNDYACWGRGGRTGDLEPSSRSTAQTTVGVGEQLLVVEAVQIGDGRVRLRLRDQAGQALGWGSVVSRSGLVLFEPGG